MMFNPIRTMLTLTVEVAEALLHFVDFNEAADELWYSERLAEAEAEEEVAEPNCGETWHMKGCPHPTPPLEECIYVANSMSSSVAPSPVPAADEPLPGSASNQGVEPGSLQLTEIELRDLGEAARNFAVKWHDDTYRSQWYDLAEKAFRIADAMK